MAGLSYIPLPVITIATNYSTKVGESVKYNPSVQLLRRPCFFLLQIAYRVPTRTRNREGIREQHKANMTLNNMAGPLFLTILLALSCPRKQIVLVAWQVTIDFNDVWPSVIAYPM